MFCCTCGCDQSMQHTTSIILVTMRLRLAHCASCNSKHTHVDLQSSYKHRTTPKPCGKTKGCRQGCRRGQLALGPDNWVIYYGAQRCRVLTGPQALAVRHQVHQHSDRAVNNDAHNSKVLELVNVTGILVQQLSGNTVQSDHNATPPASTHCMAHQVKHSLSGLCSMELAQSTCRW